MTTSVAWLCYSNTEEYLLCILVLHVSLITMSWNKSLQSPVLKEVMNVYANSNAFCNGLWNALLIKANGVNMGRGGEGRCNGGWWGLLSTPTIMMANHNTVTWHRELYLFLLLIHCLHWFTCRSILMNQRLKHHNYFRTDISFLFFFLFICVFCSFSLLHAAVANILWREQGTNTDGFFHILYITMKCSSIVPSVWCLFFFLWFILYSYSNYLPPCNIWGIWFKEKL